MEEKEFDLGKLRNELVSAVNETLSEEDLAEMRGVAGRTGDHSENAGTPQPKTPETPADGGTGETEVAYFEEVPEEDEEAEEAAEGAAAEELSKEAAEEAERVRIAREAAAARQRALEEEERERLEEEEREKRRERRAKTAGKLLITFLLLLLLAGIAAGAYLYMGRFYKTHFFTATVINGIDASGLTAGEVKKQLLGISDTYELTVLERNDRSEVLTAKDIGRSYVDNDQVEQILAAQDHLQWLFAGKEQKNYTVSFQTAYDRNAALKAIENLDCIRGTDIVPPADARIVTAPDGKYEIIPETEGNMVDRAKVAETVLAAIDSGAESVDIDEAGCYLEPAVRSDDEALNKRMNDWNAFFAVNVTYQFGPYTETIDASVVKPYIIDNDYEVTLATDWIKVLVYKWGQKYDTFGLEREFTTHDGVRIKIPAGGDYGWCINKDKTIEDVIYCIRNGVTGTREPVWLFKAMGWDNNDITGTYCEVSIPEQHMWVYKDGRLVIDTDVVTGAPTNERKTYPGCFAIDGKKRDAVLGRLDVQGYASPVSFWLPFDGGRGLHDAPWRSYFGDSIYLTNGSHGCVNIPLEKMETVYNTLEIGMAVIVYDDVTPVPVTPPLDEEDMSDTELAGELDQQMANESDENAENGENAGQDSEGAASSESTAP